MSLCKNKVSGDGELLCEGVHGTHLGIRAAAVQDVGNGLLVSEGEDEGVFGTEWI